MLFPFPSICCNRTSLARQLTLSQTTLVFTCLQYKSFENTVGKGEIACNEQFLLFSQCFLLVGELSVMFVKFKFVMCEFFQFSRV